MLSFKGIVLCWNSELEEFSKWPREAHRERRTEAEAGPGSYISGLGYPGTIASILG